MDHLATWLFGGFGLAAITAGGIVMAFSAKRPNRLISWVSAYLVLIVGLLQIGLGAGLSGLIDKPQVGLIIASFVIYNLGNAGVLIGTIYKNRLRVLVDGGGALLAAAMVLFLLAIREAKLSWQLVLFYVFVLIILVSMPIGLTLSRKHKH